MLKRVSQQYNMLIYQHKSDVVASNEKLGNKDVIIPTLQFKKVIGLAKTDQVDLLISPEYSCHWTVLEWLVSDKENWPEDFCLWALASQLYMLT